MPDFLQGMLSAKPIRDKGMEGMRDAALRDYGQELRSRRAQKELPAFLRGDPSAQLNLASMGIGGPPESPEQREQRDEVKAGREEDRALRKERFAWEKKANKATREESKELAKAGRVERKTRFESEFGFRKEQAKASKEERDVSREESKRRWDVGQDWKKKDWDRVETRDKIIDSHNQTQEKRAQERHELDQAVKTYRQEKAVNKDAILPDVISNQAGNYMPMPQMPQEARTNPEVRKEYNRELDRWRSDMVKSVVNVKKAIDSGMNYEQAMDISFPEARQREAIVREVEGATIQQMEMTRQQELIKLQAERDQKLEAQREKSAMQPMSQAERFRKSSAIEKQIAPLERIPTGRRTPSQQTEFKRLLRKLHDIQQVPGRHGQALDEMAGDIATLWK